MPEERSLHRKLAQIMYEAERIPKNGTAPAVLGGYPFVQVGDAADYIRKALAEHVVTMMPTTVRILSQTDRETKAGGSMTTVDIMVDWTLTDGESGESIVIQSFGAGADGGDKYSGKAQTNAMKYALLMGFLLSTGEDPELGEHEAAVRPRPGQTAGGDTQLNAPGRQEPPAPVRSGSAATPAVASAEPPLDEAEIASLVASNTETLRPVVYIGQKPGADIPNCPVHGSPMRLNRRGWYCSRKLEDGTYCKETREP